MRLGVFENFKWGNTTLLIWSDGPGIHELHRMFCQLANGELSGARVDQMPWISSADGTELELRAVSAGRELLDLRHHENGKTINWCCSTERFAEFADLVEALVAPTVKTGHQYLETPGQHPLQVIVAKGEYGPDARMRPIEGEP